MSHKITVEGGKSVRLPTAGKYCDRDIVVTATGSGGGEDHLDDFLANTLTAINSDVTSIVGHACRGLSKLKTVNLPNATSIGTYAFYGCTALTSVNAPKVSSLGTYSFYNCKISYVNFPKVTGIAQNAFYDCDLVIADFGVANKINQAAFAYCRSLEALILRRTSSICTLSVATNAFTSTPIAEGTGYVYVPALIEEYKTATNWVNYASQFRPLVATVADLASIDGSVYDRAWVDDEYCVYLYNGSSWAKEA